MLRSLLELSFLSLRAHGEIFALTLSSMVISLGYATITGSAASGSYYLVFYYTITLAAIYHGHFLFCLIFR